MASVSEQGTMSVSLPRHSHFYRTVECKWLLSVGCHEKFWSPKMIPRGTNIWASFCSPACCEMYWMATDDSVVSRSPIHSSSAVQQSPLIQRSVGSNSVTCISKVMLSGFNCVASSQLLAELCSTLSSPYPEHYAYLFATNMIPFVIAMHPSL